jgi:hypothetical protein
VRGAGGPSSPAPIISARRTAGAATLIDVFVLDHEPPAEAPRRQRHAGFAQRISDLADARRRAR